MATKKDYYSYALDENTHLIEIKYAAKGSEYRCPNCGAIMIPRQGKIRCWHFAHKANIENCSYETYLHKLAKMRIRECFNKSSSFSITFNVHVTCAAECPVGKQQSCTWIDTKEFNLKQYYDLCEEEVSVGKFKADLCLSHSKNKNREPILIEIWVTHKSTEEKCDSGYRIIEIHIESEEDINKIVSKRSIREYREYMPSMYGYSEDEPYARFYNFKTDCNERQPDESHQSAKSLFWIDSRGLFRFNNYREIDHMFRSKESVKCLTPNSHEIENSIFCIASAKTIDWDFAFRTLAESGLGIKYCTMCRWYRKNKFTNRMMCILYRSKDLNQYPRTSDAKSCPHFEQIDYRQYYEACNIDYDKECQECEIKINGSIVHKD